MGRILIIKFSKYPLCRRKAIHVGYSIQSITGLSWSEKGEFYMKLSKIIWITFSFKIQATIPDKNPGTRSKSPLPLLTMLIIRWQFFPASVGKPESENANRFWSPNGGSWPQAFHAWTETVDENATLLACDRIRCFVKKVKVSIASYTFISLTKMSIFSRKGWFSNYILESQPARNVLLR